MTAPTLLRRRVRDQPVDGHLDAGRHPRSRSTSGRRCARPTSTSATPSSWSSRVAGLPDMVYAANGGLIVNGKAVVARFAYPQRAGEAAAYAEWMARHGFDPAETRHVNEGQGDLLVVGSIVLAGHGFRTDRRAHDEIAAHRRHAGRQPRAGRPALLPPRHRAGGARRHHHRLLPAGVQPSESRAQLPSCSPTPSRSPAPTPTCSGLNAVSDGLQRRAARRRHRLRRAAARGRVPARSASTCPSCSRAADPSNAARWRCIRDRSSELP